MNEQRVEIRCQFRGMAIPDGLMVTTLDLGARDLGRTLQAILEGFARNHSQSRGDDSDFTDYRLDVRPERHRPFVHIHCPT